MIISLIYALDDNRGIGSGGSLPWHLRADLKRFKRITMGHHLVMGRKTFESIGKPLPGRTSIIVTRHANYSAVGCQVVHSLDDAIRLAQTSGEGEGFIIGGGEIFAQALPLANRLYQTRVHVSLKCDVFFPQFDSHAWTEIARSYQPTDVHNEYPSTFSLLEKVVCLSPPLTNFLICL